MRTAAGVGVRENASRWERLAGAGSGRDAAEAGEWRDRYPGAVTSSAYLGRYGWNAVDYTGRVPDDELRELVDSSYDAIVAALPKSRRPPKG